MLWQNFSIKNRIEIKHLFSFILQFRTCHFPLTFTELNDGSFGSSFLAHFPSKVSRLNSSGGVAVRRAAASTLCICHRHSSALTNEGSSKWFVLLLR
jgi:hypothetical protein